MAEEAGEGGGAPAIVLGMAAPAIAPVAVAQAAVMGVRERALKLGKDSHLFQHWMAYTQRGFSVEDQNLGEAGQLYQLYLLSQGEREKADVWREGQTFVVFVTDRVVWDDEGRQFPEPEAYHQAEPKFFSATGGPEEDYLLQRDILDVCASYVLRVDQFTPATSAEPGHIMSCTVVEGVQHYKLDAPEESVFPLWDSATTAHGGHVIENGIQLSLRWDQSWMRKYTPSPILTSALKVKYTPPGGDTRSTRGAGDANTEVFKRTEGVDGVPLVVSGVKSTFALDAMVSLPFRRQTTDAAKRTAFLGSNEGYFLITKSVFDLVLGAYSKTSLHRDKWASLQNFLPACKQTPVMQDLEKFDKFLHLYTDINSVDSDNYIALRDFCQQSITFDVSNIICLANSLSMFDKLRVIVHDSSFLDASTHICNRMTSGDLEDVPPMYLHYVAHEALCQYSSYLRDPSCSRFIGHPPGEAARCWAEVLDFCFSTDHLNYVKVNYVHLMGKRSNATRSVAGASAGPSTQTAVATVPPIQTAATTAPKKRKRAAVDESKRICTTQALFEMDKGQGYKACTRTGCTGHYGMGSMTKEKAMDLLGKYSSLKSYNRLKQQVGKFYG